MSHHHQPPGQPGQPPGPRHQPPGPAQVVGRLGPAGVPCEEAPTRQCELVAAGYDAAARVAAANALLLLLRGGPSFGGCGGRGWEVVLPVFVDSCGLASCLLSLLQLCTGEGESMNSLILYMYSSVPWESQQ